MLNSYKKKQNNPITEVFADLTENQKMSILNMLTCIVVSEGGHAIKDKEIEYLNAYVDILGVRNDRSKSYLHAEGSERMISDLKKLSKSQLEILAVTCSEIIMCEGRPSNTKITVTAKFFGQLGLQEKEFVAIIENARALKKHFGD